MANKRLIAKGIITRIESRIKNKENCQFKSRVLGGLKFFQKEIIYIEHLKWTHLVEKIPNAWSMSKKNIIQLSVKHHENMRRETAAWRWGVVSSKENFGDLGVCAVDGSGSESSSIMVSSSVFVLMVVVIGVGVPGTELGDGTESEWRSE